MPVIAYGTFKNYSTLDRLPKTEEAVKIAKAIGTIVEYLVSGEDTDFEDETPVIEIKPHHEYEPLNGKIRIMAEEPTILVPLAPPEDIRWIGRRIPALLEIHRV